MAPRPSGRSLLLLTAAAALLWAGPAFVGGGRGEPARGAATALRSGSETPTEAFKMPYGERAPLPKGYGIRTGLSDLLKPLNSEYGVTAKEDSIPTYIVLVTGIVLLFLFYLLLLLINNQSVLLPPEDEFDEYVANFLPYFFFGDK
eukprot:CAMPEP_0204602842 /NCGR_PEP_ID=MMETSP0661-20131031/56899_1 /ASSEMBLY_ACC=CAM_ASM_000606 /TAXON_ID=109239 /ORGANISM="Alexandrium margalefi, Strain AMGDE01CS-322" /LENGTH=145 /DNA_ID=CAMNT_0051613855 /DNA_START=87 /DNA_END=524 /DNA_ORIENTATION=+